MRNHALAVPVLLPCVLALAASLPVRAQVVKLGAEFQVNTFTTGTQDEADVGPDGGSGFVVVWISYDTTGPEDQEEVQAQRYGSSGAALGSEFQVNAYTTGSQSESVVA